MQSTFLFYSDRICLISRLLCFQKAAWKTSLCTVYPPFRELKRNALLYLYPVERSDILCQMTTFTV